MKKKKELDPKKWGVFAITVLAVMVVGMGLLTYIVDPYFHYHAPVEGISYRLYEQRYINDGISRQFEYDAVIIGNSLSENFETTKLDELFGTKSIKLPYSGAGYKELWSALGRTLSYNPKIKKVFVIVDTEDMPKDKDYMRYSDYPDYLYDNSVWNDAMYLWNKDTFYRGTLYNLLMTVAGKESTTMDEYSAKDGETGADVVLPLIGEMPDKEDAPWWGYNHLDAQMVTENINQNVISVTEEYPDTEFHLIYAAPSIARWGKYYIWGDRKWRVESCNTATELLLTQENVYLYSFQDDFELVCDLDNYRDTIHFTTEVSDYMLEQVAFGNRRITADNYEEYFETIREFYYEYDYTLLRVDE